MKQLLNTLVLRNRCWPWASVPMRSLSKKRLQRRAAVVLQTVVGLHTVLEFLLSTSASLALCRVGACVYCLRVDIEGDSVK